MNREELQQKRREILMKILNKDEMLVELKEIKDLLITLNSKKLKYTADKGLRETIQKLTATLENLPEIPKKIESPVVNVSVPPKTKINWEDMPEEFKPLKTIEVGNLNVLAKFFKNIIDGLNWTGKQIETFLAPFFNRIISLLIEPDRTEIERDISGDIVSVTDFYGQRKVTYRISRNNLNEVRSVIRTEQ